MNDIKLFRVLLWIVATLLFLTICIIGCSKEYSRENAEIVPDDSIPGDTVYNNLITTCDIFIGDNTRVRMIYPQVKTKLWPGSHKIFDSILIKAERSTRYRDTFDLKNYPNVIDMSKYFKGDSFLVRYEIRNRYSPPEWVDSVTLKY